MPSRLRCARRVVSEQDGRAGDAENGDALARRVMAALERWNLAFDNSGGDALMETPSGVFARLAAEAVAEEDLNRRRLLALLKHSLCRLGGAPGAFTAARSKRWSWRCCAARAREPGTGGLAREIAHFRDELGKLRRGEGVIAAPCRTAGPPSAIEALDRAEAACHRTCAWRWRRSKVSAPSERHGFRRARRATSRGAD